MTGKDDSTAGSPKMPARGKRVRDYGAPEPKPSRKVALDEVLRTLQDLVGNELNIEPSQHTKSEKKRDEPAAPPDEITLDIANVAFPADESVIEEIELSTPAPAPEPAPPAKPIPPEGLQQELPHLEPDTFTPATPEPAKKPSPTITAQDAEPIDTELPELEISKTPAPAPIAAKQDAEPIDTELPELEIGAAPVAAPAPAVVAAAEDHNHTPTDIPVLSDVVDEIEETESVARPTKNPLPSVADTRKLAIQVAAKLNVELRKAGKPVLSSDIIARLAHALEEALAKAGANRENGAPK